MAVFGNNSRYVKHARVYQVIDRRGRLVVALMAAAKPTQTLLGQHLKKEGQRLDHLANFDLQDPTGFWRLCELNDVMLPDALAEADIIEIPAVL